MFRLGSRTMRVNKSKCSNKRTNTLQPKSQYQANQAVKINPYQAKSIPMKMWFRSSLKKYFSDMKESFIDSIMRPQKDRDSNSDNSRKG